jgi:hypothetical protein
LNRAVESTYLELERHGLLSVEAEETVDTLGGLLNDLVQTALIHAKSRGAPSTARMPWKGQWARFLTDPEGYFHAVDGQSTTARLDPLPRCEGHQCRSRALVGVEEYGSRGGRAVGLSVESKRARCPPPAGGLRSKLGLKFLYDCPVRFFEFFPHPDLIIIWNYYARIVHFSCKSRRGHPLSFRWG